MPSLRTPPTARDTPPVASHSCAYGARLWSAEKQRSLFFVNISPRAFSVPLRLDPPRPPVPRLRRLLSSLLVRPSPFLVEERVRTIISRQHLRSPLSPDDILHCRSSPAAAVFPRARRRLVLVAFARSRAWTCPCFVHRNEVSLPGRCCRPPACVAMTSCPVTRVPSLAAAAHSPNRK